MPIPPPVVTLAFDSVDWAMNSARAKLNDCPLSLSGNLLSDTQPYSQQFAIDGWRQFQRDLAQAGDPACTEEFLSPSLPVVANIDPWTQVYLSQQYYFDGVSYYQPPYVNLLPQDLIVPLHVEERLGGTTQLFTRMTACDNGVPRSPKTTNLRFWEWRSVGPGNGNGIWMPGATVTRDIFVRYASFLPDFKDNAPLPSTPWYEQPLPMLRVADILGFYIAAAFAFSRGSAEAKAAANSFWADGKDAMRQYLNSTTMKIRQRINHRRRSFAAGRHQGWNWW
jgi:hypothetical protein